jgi:hypothetical protein
MKDFIGVYDNFLSKQECELAITKFDQLVSQGFGYDRSYENTTKTKKDDHAISSCAEELHSFGIDEIHRIFNQKFWTHLAYKAYLKEYDILEDCGKHIITVNKIQKSVPGQGYHVWHFEASQLASSSRLLTYIVYLNDVEEGGETEFLYQHKRIPPKQGTIVIFPASFTHTHRGNTVLKGNKYIMTGWVEFVS